MNERNETAFCDQLKEFQVRQRALAGILGDASAVTGRLNMAAGKDLSQLSERVKNDAFKVMVSGTFKNGKSALINALLGEKILPSYSLPCTAVINEIKYGPAKKAVLHFKKKLPSPLPESLAEKAVEHMAKHKGKEIPPLVIPYDEIEDYVVIPMGADPDEMKLQSPYEKVELFHPLDILKNGIEIIDSPGLNEDETRTATTMAYLGRVDAVLYVFNANAVCAADEMRFIENDLAGNNYEAVVFAVNRIDQVPEDERGRILEYAKKKLKAIYPDAPVFGTSALQALEGRTKGDAEKFRASGFPELEAHLADFLTRERGKAKLAQPAKKLRHILGVDALGKAIPSERALLDKTLEEIKAKESALLPRLDSLQRKKEAQRTILEAKIERKCHVVERLVRQKVLDIATSVPAWIDGFVPKKAMPVIPTAKKIEPVTAEIMDFVKGKIKDEQLEWQRKILMPEMAKNSEDIFADAEKGFQEVFAEIDQVLVEVAGPDATSVGVPFWQRAAGIAGGFVLGDPSLMVTGGLSGIGKEFAKTAALEVGGVILLAAINALNPFTFIALLGGLIIRSLGGSKKNALNKLKAGITDKVVQTLREGADAQAEKTARKYAEKLEEVIEQIVDSVGREIDGVARQLESVRNAKKDGQESCDKRRAELAKCEEDIRKLNVRLDDLIFELAGV